MTPTVQISFVGEGFAHVKGSRAEVTEALKLAGVVRNNFAEFAMPNGKMISVLPLNVTCVEDL